MKAKIIVIILLMLIISSYTSIAGNQNNLSDDDVPTWNIDDSWTYTINDFTIDVEGLYLTGNIDTLTWTVVNTNDNVYTVDFTGRLNCVYNFQMDNDTEVNGRLRERFNRLTGTIEFSKSNLEICSVSAEIKGLTIARISTFPIPLPLPFRIDVDIGISSSGFPLYQFPLYEQKTWDMPNITTTVDVIIGDLFGIITYPLNFEMELPYVENLFVCNEKEEIDVEAGTFEAYKIALLHELTGLHYYYSPSVENLVKIDFHVENSDILINIDGELKE